MKQSPIRSYQENGMTINVYAAKEPKRSVWIKNGSFYAAKLRIEDSSGMFAQFSRKAGRA